MLREGLAWAGAVGLTGLTIGGLADRLGMSKSGLYAHAASKEQLQIDVLGLASDHFITQVIHPALATPRGEPRLRVLLERWLGWSGYTDRSLPGGCIFVGAATELDDEPDGEVRDRFVGIVRDMLDTIAIVVAGGVREGHFRTDTDAEQVAFEVYAIMLGCHQSTRLLRDPRAGERARTAFDRVIASITARPPHRPDPDDPHDSDDEKDQP